MRKSILVTGLILTVALAACGGDVTVDGVPDIEVLDARIGQPTGPNAALYFTAENRSDGADVLEGATTDVAVSAELHETVTRDDGTMGMQALDAPLEVVGGGSLVLEPGGIHLMLVDVDRLEVGDTVVVTLTWQIAGEMEIEAEVVDPADTMEHDGHDG